MNIARWRLAGNANRNRTFPRRLGIFATWRLQAYGYTIAAGYAAILFYLYRHGQFLLDGAGWPYLNDFTYFWIGGRQALHGKIVALYNPTQFAAIKAAFVGPDHTKYYFYPNWPYPPIFFLVLAPLALLPYVTAFLAWEAVTLLGCVVVVFLIVRRVPAIALVLASPFSALDIAKGQTGFFGASLVGAALLSLERRPLLSGVFIGCLTYKPQYGIMFPVALVAAKHWRAFFSATISAFALVLISIAAFGIAPWQAFPHSLVGQADEVLGRHVLADATWTDIQSLYGLVRACHGDAALAWLAQGCAASAAAAIVWQAWRSSSRYPLKAALLSPATFIATPYGWNHDLTLILIPMAFVITDQIRYGLLRGEQTIMIALFIASFAMVFGKLPVGLCIMITLVALILRRIFGNTGLPAAKLAI